MTALVAVGCGTAATPAPTPAPAASTDLTAKVDALQTAMDVQTKTINPATSTVMMEYNHRFADLWYAVQAQNWDLAKYEVKEMGKVQAVAENTRPKRAAGLQSFKKSSLDVLAADVEKKDKAAFEATYDKAIASCNACHAIDTKFVKVQRPTQAPVSNIDYAGQK